MEWTNKDVFNPYGTEQWDYYLPCQFHRYLWPVSTHNHTDHCMVVGVLHIRTAISGGPRNRVLRRQGTEKWSDSQLSRASEQNNPMYNRARAFSMMTYDSSIAASKYGCRNFYSRWTIPLIDRVCPVLTMFFLCGFMILLYWKQINVNRFSP